VESLYYEYVRLNIADFRRWPIVGATCAATSARTYASVLAFGQSFDISLMGMLFQVELTIAHQCTKHPFSHSSAIQPKHSDTSWPNCVRIS
jgi:hypothetical protein